LFAGQLYILHCESYCVRMAAWSHGSYLPRRKIILLHGPLKPISH